MKNMIGLLLLTGVISMNAAASASVCSPVPGADQIWSRPSLRWVWIGESHGSDETPATFGDLVCDALARGRQVTVAVERPTSEQPALESVLTASDLASAEKDLLNQPGWQQGMDGRASEAMLRLLVSLRDLRKKYSALQISAIDGPSYTAALGSRDEAMGRSVLSLAKRPEDLTLVLTGNVHAMKQPIFGFKTSAMYLPQQELISLEVTNRGDSKIWNANDKGCGIFPGGVADKDKTRPYGIYLDPELAPVGKVDGILALGVSLTASAPAVGELSPPPECRQKFLSREKAQSTSP
jgi:hypothetical protein